ncbi:MAG: A24 family peptidase [Betaproteobacteria bacterium]|jgi:leader peptidase (prepilin peptidase)/N-methyltransferase
MFETLSLLQASFPISTSILVTLIGLLVGSFLNVVIHRLPRMLEQSWRTEASIILEQPQVVNETLSLWGPRSKCPHCREAISGFDNIPILSFAVLRGRCRHCHARISYRYPLVELVAGILTLVTLLVFGFSWSMVGAMLLTYSLISLTFIDFDCQLLPDQITLPGLWLGLLFNLNSTFCTIDEAVIGAIAGYLSLWLVYQSFKLATGKEGMGYGDFKLLALLGAWFGWMALPGLVLISSAAGAIIGIMLVLLGRSRDEAIAFGPYLALAGLMMLFFKDTVMGLYLPQGVY